MERNLSLMRDMVETDPSRLISNAYKRKYYFSTLEIVYISLLGVLAGLLSSYVPFIDLLKSMLPPPNPLPQLLGGHHLWWMAIAFGLTRKKGAAISTAGIKGILEFMLGDPFGPVIMFLNLLEGASLEAGFIIPGRMKNAHDSKFRWALAGAIGNVTQPPFFWLLKGTLFMFPWYFITLACVFAFISGALISGLLGLAVVKVLNIAGIGRRESRQKATGTEETSRERSNIHQRA